MGDLPRGKSPILRFWGSAPGKLRIGRHQQVLHRTRRPSAIPFYRPRLRSAQALLGSRTSEEERRFRALVDEHMPYVWRQLRLMGVAERDLDDGCQEVFVIVHRRLAEFEGRSSLRTWIHRIAYWVASDHRKRVRRGNELAHDEAPQPPAPPHAELETEQAWRRLLGLLEQLPEVQRQVFVHFEIQGRPMSEIIELLGCSSSSAYAWLDSARETLRSNLRLAREPEEQP